MYDSLVRGSIVNDDQLRSDVLFRHQGTIQDFIASYGRLAARQVQQGRRGIRKLASDLLKIISDTRTLRAAWDYLAEKGGQAPGHDDRRYSDYSSAEVCDMSRALSRAICDGTYRPQQEKIVWVDKASGQGERPIVLLALADRVVQRAITIVLQPLLDPFFDQHSFGFRPRKGHLRALATAEYLTAADDRTCWVTHDIKNAFQHVAMPRLLDVLRSYFPDEALIQFLRTALTGQKFRGLRQGGSASPLMLNLYLDHFLDRVWRKAHPDMVLIRFADDLAVLCSNIEQAELADAELRRILVPTGMGLKATTEEAIADLHAGDGATWLGVRVTKTAGGLGMQLTSKAWAKLRKNFDLAHTKDDPQLRAERMVLAWLKSRGPAYEWSDPEKVCQRVYRTARRYGFEEIPNRDALVQVWKDGYEKWRKIRRTVRKQLRAIKLEKA